MSFKNSILLIFLMMISAGLSSKLYAQSSSIRSTPTNAEIWIKKGPQDQGRRIGQTPYEGDMDELFALAEGSLPAFIELRLEGFKPREFVVTHTSKDLSLKLDVELDPVAEVEHIKKYDLLVTQLFKAQKMIRSQNYNDAHRLLDELMLEHKDFSNITEMKGIAYYMQRDMQNALSMFRLSFSQNTENVDAYKMKVYLEKQLGVDAGVE